MKVDTPPARESAPGRRGAARSLVGRLDRAALPALVVQAAGIALGAAGAVLLNVPVVPVLLLAVGLFLVSASHLRLLLDTRRRTVRTEKNVRELQEAERHTRKALSTVVWATEKNRDTASSVGRTAPDVRWLRSRAEEVLRERVEHRERTEVVHRYSPSVVSATAVKGVTHATAGRAAAMVTADPKSGAKMQRLLSTQPGETHPKVCAIVTEERARVLETVAEVSLLHPTLGPQPWDADVAFLVIEDRALVDGPWAGVLRASGLALFRQIMATITEAKKGHCMVVYVKTDIPPGQFSEDLERAADILVDGQSPVLRVKGHHDAVPRFVHEMISGRELGGDTR